MSKYWYLWPYAGASFLYYGFIGCFVSYLALYLTDKGFDSIEIGAVFAISTLARVVLGQLIAYLSDIKQQHLGFYRLGLMGAILLLLPCFLIANNYWFLLLIILSLGCFMSVVSQVELLCLDAANSDVTIYNRIRLFGSFGFVVCAIFMGKFLEVGSPIAVVYFGIIVLLSGFLISLKMKGFPHKQAQPRTIGDFGDFINKCLSSVFIAFLFSSILLHISFAPFISFFTQYLAFNGYQGVEIGILFSLGAAAEIVFFFFAGAVVGRFGYRKLLIFGLLITAIRWYLQSRYIDILSLAIFTQCLHAFSFGLMHSVSVQFLRQYFEPKQQGKAQFMYFGIAFGLGTAIGSWLTGITWQNGIGSEFTFTWAAVSCLIGALVLWLVPNKQFLQSMPVKSKIKV